MADHRQTEYQRTPFAFTGDARTTAVNDADLGWHFPDVELDFTMQGDLVMVQMRRPVGKSKGGIILASDTRDAEKWNTQVGKVVAMGPLAPRILGLMADTVPADNAPEGWRPSAQRPIEIGDFVRVPLHGGDNIEIPIEGGEPALFKCFHAKSIIYRVDGDPRKIKAYI